MTILPQLFQDYSTIYDFSELNTIINDLSYPITSFSKPAEYANFIQSIGDMSYSFIRFTIKSILENADRMFLNMKDRSKRFHVKAARERTITTPFGDITYKRTIYSFADGSPGTYCHVDRCFGIPKYDHYDPCVKAMIVSLYADHNSMIKVGKIIGERIQSPFSLSPTRKHYAISRQTVQTIIKRSNRVYYPLTKRDKTPEFLYIMADEKWIPLQSHNENGDPQKHMVKACVVFEDIDIVPTKSESKKPRHQLINKYIHFDSESNIWDSLYQRLNELYDLDKVKEIWILGDGAHWIKHGVDKLNDHNWKVGFALDKFHFHKSLTNISNEKEIRNMMYEYIIGDNCRTDFTDLIQALIESEPEREEIIKREEKYILNNWANIRHSFRTVHMGCSMESAISHYICSSFTSVPKAYLAHNLPRYLDNRMYHLNNMDLMNIYIHSLGIEPDETGIVTIKEQLDFEMFEKKKADQTFVTKKILDTEEFLFKSI